MSHHPSPGYRALRRGRISTPGHVYLVTTICAHRHPYFGDWGLGRTTAAALTERRLWRGATLWCWVLMPDHLHVLVQLGDEPLPRLMQRVKAVTARAGGASLGRPLKVWSQGFHDRALRIDDDLRLAARYVIANPIRARLVARVGDYPFWDARWLDSDAPLL